MFFSCLVNTSLATSLVHLLWFASEYFLAGSISLTLQEVKPPAPIHLNLQLPPPLAYEDCYSHLPVGETKSQNTKIAYFVAFDRVVAACSWVGAWVTVVRGTHIWRLSFF
jgi:hypothetical protein